MIDRQRVIAAWSSPRRRALLLVALIAALAMVVTVIVLQRSSEPTPVARQAASASPMPMATPSPTPSPARCATPAEEPFVPTRVTVPGVIRNAKVLALPRDARDVPSVPPVSGAGKQQIAWDRPPGIKPGSSKGNVLLNSHTWPDGTALGNKFLKRLEKGDRIILRGDGATLCYEVDKRIEVLAADGYVPYYDREGPPQIALLVCSGQRTGPGEWTHRTIWFAKPV